MPASLPSFSGFDTHTPTSSRSGWASMPAIACRPMVPVDQTTTRSLRSGMAWDMAFDLRGKRRELRLDVTQFDRPEKIVILGRSEPLDVSIEMTVIALTRSKSRLMFEVEVKPRNMRARLMLQTARLGKAQLDRKFAERVGKFLGDLTSRRG